MAPGQEGCPTPSLRCILKEERQANVFPIPMPGHPADVKLPF
eukprot:COSAG06_NODE_66935_length_253_cov_0.668831_1_plen_41_part_10